MVIDGWVPCLVVCHICGREFGAASIDLHVEQCLKKWEDVENRKPRQKRKPAPECPRLTPDMTQEEFNEAVRARFPAPARSSSPRHVPQTRARQVRCQTCGQAVPADSLQEHLGICGSEPTASAPAPKKPTSIACHICGREFGTKSIEIHRQRCAEMWNMREALKPQSARRQLPEKPTGTSMTQEEFNKAAKDGAPEEYIPASRTPRADLSAKPKTTTCHLCKKEYSLASIQIHKRQCAKLWEARRKGRARSGPASPRGQWGPGTRSASEVRAPRMEPCHFCGKQFLSSSLHIHEKKCQAEQDTASPKAKPARPSRSPRSASPKRSTTPKPAGVVCYICGQLFGAKSIAIHRPQCAKLWEARQASVPHDERRPLPNAPDTFPGMHQEDYNAAAMQCFKQAVSVCCPACGKKFTQDSLQVHIRSCKAKIALAQEDEKLRAPPQTIICHICGQGFGKASIGIHTPQCRKKWEEREKLKAPKDRRCAPEEPPSLESLGLQEYNNVAAKIHQEASCFRCPDCNEQVPEAKLKVHRLRCAREAPCESEPSEAAKKPVLEMCHVCGKEFGTASIAKHVLACIKKWEASESTKPQPRPVPEAPVKMPGMSQEEYNRAARNVFETATCSSCNFCNRTFPEEKFAEHVRVCEQFVQKDEAEELVSPSDSPRLDRSHRYFNIACHLCGKKFGKASIDIHVQQCTAVQEQRQAVKPWDNAQGSQEEVCPSPLLVKCLKCGSSLQAEDFHGHTC